MEIKSIGIPYVQNYTKEKYKAGNQNWSVTKDENGVMYYGNANGLLSYDGQHWKLNEMPDRQIVRVAASDKKGKVYVGGFGEFGYWSYDDEGVFQYTSLVNLVPGGLMNKDEIWKIYFDGDRILFQSFARIYIYENNKITIVFDPERPLLFLFKADRKFFVEVIHKGLFELSGNNLKFVEGSQALGSSGILSILPFRKNTYLIGTRNDGLFLYDGNSFIPWRTGADGLLKAGQLNNGVTIDNKYFAFGTILNGIVILDTTGSVVQQINKTTGLQNNTVLSLYVDDMQDVWMGLDNGIDRIELNSPLSYYFDQKGLLGTIYSSQVYNGKIYLATNLGVFYSDWITDNANRLRSFDFKLINGSEGQVWGLTLIDNQLISCHNEKTYRIEGTSIIKISDNGGGWIIKKLNNKPDFLVQGTYTGLVIYKIENGKWVFSNAVSGFSDGVRYIEQDSKGQLWVGHPYKGLYKLKLSDDLTHVASLKYYDDKNGLPSNLKIGVQKFNDQIVFLSKQGIYTYDEINDNFIRYDQLNKKLGSFNSASNIIKANDRQYWFIDHGRIAFVDIPQAGNVEIDSSTFSMLSGKMIDFYENINKINDSLFLISIDDGFAIYSTDVRLKKIDYPKVLIQSVKNITERATTITESNFALSIVQIPFSQNNISITYSLPYYKNANIQYQYQLKGYSKLWSEWSPITLREFTNLRHGNYQFLVRAKINGEFITPITTYQFTILPPWYSTVWAYFGYLILAASVIIFFHHLHNKKLIKQQKKLWETHEKEKEDSLRKEREANEQRIAQIKTHQLEADLAAKNRELANSAINIVSKNELLQKISDEVMALKDKDGKKLSLDQIKRIQKVINDGMNDERDWDLFENSFDEAHENFFKKIKAMHPKLSPSDLKMCAYLRMNMTSKEIASILNITIRGVEIRRYRLRKKLCLDHDKNLVEFLMEL